MSGAPAFSIVIPAYNYAHFLRRAVTSACTQEGADAEVLVIDDGSTDDTPAVMDKLSAEFGERLTYHRQPNQGPAAARARLSRGGSGRATWETSLSRRRRVTSGSTPITS